MPTIRTIFQPDVERDVDEHEAAMLAREGLLHTDPVDAAAGPKPGAGAKAVSTDGQEGSGK